jgi:hypothetical protein
MNPVLRSKKCGLVTYKIQLNINQAARSILFLIYLVNSKIFRSVVIFHDPNYYGKKTVQMILKVTRPKQFNSCGFNKNNFFYGKPSKQQT